MVEYLIGLGYHEPGAYAAWQRRDGRLWVFDWHFHLGADKRGSSPLGRSRGWRVLSARKPPRSQELEGVWPLRVDRRKSGNRFVEALPRFLSAHSSRADARSHPDGYSRIRALDGST